MSKKSFEVTHAKMSDEMQRDALQCVLMAEYMYKDNNDIATYIAKEFDRKHQPSWYCIVGSFGCYYTSSCYTSALIDIHFTVSPKPLH
uniref:Dynein light chain n=1 Tax=Sinocyclocheilus rhinocerous TaxID=307959 RepID=A0A673JW43_9TELE